MTLPSLVGDSEVVVSRLFGSHLVHLAVTTKHPRKEAKMSQQVQEKYEESHLYKIRHSAAHIMAQAVLEMFPDGKVSIGPPVENGFYYDFDRPRYLTPVDLED